MPVYDNTQLDDTPVWDASASFEGGQVSNSRANLLQPNQHILLQNMDIAISGELITRRGIKQLGNNLAEIIQGIAFYQTPTTDELILAAGGILRAYDGTAWGLAGSLLQRISPYVPAVFVQGVDILYIAQSDSNLARYQNGALLSYPSVDTSEVTLISCDVIIDPTINNQYFILYDENGSVYIWFNVDGAGTDPAPVGITRGIVLPLSVVGPNFAQSLANALNADGKFSASYLANTVTATCVAKGSRPDGNRGTAGFGIDPVTGIAISVLTQGVTANLAPPLGISILVWHTDRLVASGVEAAPDTVYFSQFLDGSLWDRANWSLRVGAGEGDPITGLVPWTNYNLLVLKQHSIWVVGANPTQDVAEFQINRIHDRIGCPAWRTACQVGTDIFFLSDSGVRSVKNIIASEQQKEVGPALSDPIDDIIKRINPSAVDTSCAFHWRNRYILAVPIDGSAQPNCVFVFNTLTETWSGKWLGWKPTHFAARLDGQIPKMWFGRSDGTVADWMDYVPLNQETDEAFKDLGLPVASEIITRAFSWNEPACTKTGLKAEFEFNRSRAQVTVETIRDGAFPEQCEVLETAAESLSLPLTLPFTLPRSGVVRRPADLMRYEVPFREFQFRLTTSSGKLVLRSISAAAFINPFAVLE